MEKDLQVLPNTIALSFHPSPFYVYTRVYVWVHLLLIVYKGRWNKKEIVLILPFFGKCHLEVTCEDNTKLSLLDLRNCFGLWHNGKFLTGLISWGWNLTNSFDPNRDWKIRERVERIIIVIGDVWCIIHLADVLLINS